MSVEKPVNLGLVIHPQSAKTPCGFSCLGPSVVPSDSSFLLSQMLLQTLQATVCPVRCFDMLASEQTGFPNLQLI